MAVYAAGSVLIAFGLGGFVSDFTMPVPTTTKYIYTGTTICGVIITWGVILCLAARFPYAFGIRLFLGTLFVTLSAIIAAYVVDFCMIGIFLLSDFAVAAVLFQAGCYCFLVASHIRRRRKRKHLAS